MDNQPKLDIAIKESFPQILKQFTSEQFIRFRRLPEPKTSCSPKIKQWIRNELLCEESELLREFIENRHLYRDEMTTYILKQFKAYAVNGKLTRNQIVFYVFADADGNRHGFPQMANEPEQV